MQISQSDHYVNLHGYRVYEDASKGHAPYFQNLLTHRVNKKLSCNVAVCGEGGIGKSYLATDICRIHEGIDDKGEDRFKVSQVVYFFGDYMEAMLDLPLGKPLCFDEPSYAMGKREWFKEVNKLLVSTMESGRFKVHPIFIPIINLSLLDRTVRKYLIQFQINVIDRGVGVCYRIKPSLFTDKVYFEYLCALRYGLLDSDLCSKDSCLGCGKLMNCNIFRAQYERKKASIQDDRYEQAKSEARKKESSHLTEPQIENLCMNVKDQWLQDGKINVNRLVIAMQDTYDITLSTTRAYRLKALIEAHHHDKLVKTS
jgi:hypothetical protein